MGNETPKNGDPVPVQRDPETEATIDRCVQLHVSLTLAETFMDAHQQSIADLYVAAKLPLPFPKDRHEEWEDTHRQLKLMKTTLRALGLTDDEITARLQACHEERSYPTDPRYAPRPPLLVRLAKRARAALRRMLGVSRRTPWQPTKGGQRDLYH